MRIDMKKTLNAGFVIFLLVFICACSSADVSGDETLRKYGDTKFTNEGSGTQNITVNIKGSSETTTDTDQTTDNDPANETSPNLAAGSEGATVLASDEGLVKGVTNTAKRMRDYSKKESEKQPATNTEIVPQKQPVETTIYETKFHHTTTGSSDGGKSVVLCPGQTIDFDKCSASGVDIPFHGYDTGRIIYWNMKQVPAGDIICTKGGKTYRYRADKTIVYGDCR